MKKGKLIIIMLVIYSSLTSVLYAQEKFPNKEERIYTLSLIWRELHYNFAFPETLKRVNADSLYMAYLPKVEQAENMYDYYRTLSSFMACFDDGHTRIIASQRPDDTPPVTITNFGKKIVISNIAKSLADKIPVGSEIMEVNHIPAVKYVKDSVYQYMGASTAHWKFDKSVVEMLAGKPQSVVDLIIKTPEGKEKEVNMVRNYYTNGAKEIMINPSTPPVSIRIIDGKYGYIQLTSFQNIDTINSVFNRYLPQLRMCKGLIVDIRGNRGGTDQAWENIADHLILQPQFQLTGKWYCRKNIPTYRMWGKYNPNFKDYYQETAMEEIRHSPYINEINDSLKLHQPLVIISGQYVGSAAEDFLSFMKENKKMLIVGGPSVGCMSEPMFFSTPGDLEVIMCVKKYVNSDGTQPNDTGILPDIAIERDYNAYLQGKDNILERAVKELDKQVN